MKDNLNGTYSCHYEAPRAGTFELEVKVGKEHIKGSPFRPLVEAGEPKPDKCWAEGPGLKDAVAGEEAFFKVFAAVRISFFFPIASKLFSRRSLILIVS